MQAHLLPPVKRAPVKKHWIGTSSTLLSSFVQSLIMQSRGLSDNESPEKFSFFFSVPLELEMELISERVSWAFASSSIWFDYLFLRHAWILHTGSGSIRLLYGEWPQSWFLVLALRLRNRIFHENGPSLEVFLILNVQKVMSCTWAEEFVWKLVL